MTNLDLKNIKPLDSHELETINGGGRIGDAMKAVGEILIALSNFF